MGDGVFLYMDEMRIDRTHQKKNDYCSGISIFPCLFFSGCKRRETTEENEKLTAVV